MSDNTNNEELDDFFSEEELEKAKNALNSSKSVRLKETKKKKESDNKDGKKNDPVILACIIGIIVVVIGAILYFVLPKLFVKNLGMNINELRTRYEATSIYNDSFARYGVTIPPVEYPADMEGGESSGQGRYFRALITESAPDTTGIPVIIEGRELNNGKITEFNVSTFLNDKDFMFYITLIGSYLQVLDPTLSNDNAILLATEALTSSFEHSEYYILGDAAYRVQFIPDEASSVTYLRLEVVPADTVVTSDRIESSILESVA